MGSPSRRDEHSRCLAVVQTLPYKRLADLCLDRRLAREQLVERRLVDRSLTAVDVDLDPEAAPEESRMQSDPAPAGPEAHPILGD